MGTAQEQKRWGRDKQVVVKNRLRDNKVAPK